MVRSSEPNTFGRNADILPLKVVDVVHQMGRVEVVENQVASATHLL